MFDASTMLPEIRTILAKYPTLSANGLVTTYRPTSPSKPYNPDGSGLRYEPISEAMHWIQGLCEPTKTLRYAQSSYGLKHAMQRDTGVYVTNGEFILAALLLGFRAGFRNLDSVGLNPSFNFRVIKPLAAKSKRWGL